MKLLSPEYYNGWYVGDFILKMKLDFFLGNAVKYLARYKHKNGREDLVKMYHYLERVSQFPTDWKIFTIHLCRNGCPTPDPRNIQEFCGVLDLSDEEYTLLYLICQYSVTGIAQVLYEALSVAQQLLNAYLPAQEESSHAPV